MLRAGISLEECGALHCCRLQNNLMLICLFLHKDNNTYVDWTPCQFDADNYELQTSDCAEWDLITQNKQSGTV